MNYTVLIQANEKQYIGALVAGYALKRNSAHAEEFFFDLLRGCLEDGCVATEMLQTAMRKNHIRHDALQMLARARPAA